MQLKLLLKQKELFPSPSSGGSTHFSYHDYNLPMEVRPPWLGTGGHTSLCVACSTCNHPYLSTLYNRATLPTALILLRIASLRVANVPPANKNSSVISKTGQCGVPVWLSYLSTVYSRAILLTARILFRMISLRANVFLPIKISRMVSFNIKGKHRTTTVNIKLLLFSDMQNQV